MTDAIGRLTTALSDRYRIERELGAGGMATVYLAHDVRHDRKVALKVLRPELAAILGGERFLAEIKTTANLQHPHILPLHDSGEADGLVFYVMPFVEGESLRDRLVREKQLPVDDAVRIAREVADALEYAHQQGIVHRDIKPENILLHGGHAMVADFGIALAASKSEGSTRMTETGMSLGTPAYMAPEQAMGERALTSRADVYALGAVLYEMLSGEPPFVGPTAQAIIARVMTEEPRALTLHRHTIPPHVEAAVRQALEKLPADRFATAAEFGDALLQPRTTVATGGLTVPASPPVAVVGAPTRIARYAPWAAVLGAGVIVGAIGRPLVSPQAARAPRPVARFAIRLPDSVAFAGASGATIALTPDGSRIAYVGSAPSGSRLYLRSLDRFEPVPIPGTESASLPFFSPDGLSLGFLQGRRLRRVVLAGGAVQPIVDVAGAVFGASWGPGDSVVFSSGGSLLAVPASGGRPAVIAAADSAHGESFLWPDILPNGRGILFTVFRGAVSHLALLRLPDRRITRFEQTGGYPRYVEAGFATLTTNEGSARLVAVPFDARRLTVAGAAGLVIDLPGVDPNGDANVAVSRSGDIVLQGENAGGVPDSGKLVRVMRNGSATDLGAEPDVYRDPRWSPDGRRIAATVVHAMDNDIWIYDPSQRTRTHLTFDKASSRPLWTPDGRRIAITHGHGELLLVPLDGGRPDTLVGKPGVWFAGGFTRDAHTVIMQSSPPGRRRQLSVVSLDSARAPQDFLASENFGSFTPSLSPDGRWVAYASNESGRDQVYVRALAGSGDRWQVSPDSGWEPLWSPDGREIFYWSGNRMMAAAVATTPSFAVLRRSVLFEGAFVQEEDSRSYDVAPDGRSFLMITRSARRSQQSQSTMVVVLNWFDALRGRPR